jgi:hypothetical protein
MKTGYDGASFPNLGYFMVRLRMSMINMEIMVATAAIILVVTLTAPPVAHGDEWPAPTIREKFSHPRTYFVRVLPGKSFGDPM